MHMQHTRWYSL